MVGRAVDDKLKAIAIFKKKGFWKFSLYCKSTFPALKLFPLMLW